MPDHRSDRVTQNNGLRFLVELSKQELVLLIDALLSAEMTLCILDEKHGSLNASKDLRDLQVALANRIEDLLADAVPARDGSGTPPGQQADHFGIPREMLAMKEDSK